jgi:hypothetical protein
MRSGETTVAMGGEKRRRLRHGEGWFMQKKILPHVYKYS